MNKIFRFNSEQWDIHQLNDSICLFSNSVTSDTYSIEAKVDRTCQISDDTFLVLSKLDNCYRFDRIKFSGTEVINEYSRNIHDFNRLSEDIFLFDKDCFPSTTMYSISKNSEYDDINHLISESFLLDTAFVSDRKIELHYDNKNNKYPSKLLATYKLRAFQSEEYLKVFFNPLSLKPIDSVFSSLRNSTISLAEFNTLRQLFSEENHKLLIIGKFLYNQAIKEI